MRKVLIVSDNYEISLSPTLLGFINYFLEEQYFVTILSRRENKLDLFKSDRIKVFEINLKQSVLFSNPFLKKIDRFSKRKSITGKIINKIVEIIKSFEKKIRYQNFKKEIQIDHFDQIVAVEIEGVQLVKSLGGDLHNTYYLSLESNQIIEGLGIPKTIARETIGACKNILIQDQSRGKDFCEYLDLDQSKCRYIPVSCQPREEIKKEERENIKIIYSGYFANWALLEEFINEYKMIPNLDKLSIVLQGHHLGTESYYLKIKEKFETISNSSIFGDGFYLEELKHHEFLSSFDIGLAFYRLDENKINWQNLLFSSGKIATYLWAGLAVITNIDHELTHSAPFIFMDEITTNNLVYAFEKYQLDKLQYQKMAYKYARKYYNINNFLINIF
jgi:hypothetical protein